MTGVRAGSEGTGLRAGSQGTGVSSTAPGYDGDVIALTTERLYLLNALTDAPPQPDYEDVIDGGGTNPLTTERFYPLGFIQDPANPTIFETHVLDEAVFAETTSLALTSILGVDDGDGSTEGLALSETVALEDPALAESYLVDLILIPVAFASETVVLEDPAISGAFSIQLEAILGVDGGVGGTPGTDGLSVGETVALTEPVITDEFGVPGTALPTALTALSPSHHYRLDDATEPYANSGSVGGTAEDIGLTPQGTYGGDNISYAQFTETTEARILFADNGLLSPSIQDVSFAFMFKTSSIAAGFVDLMRKTHEWVVQRDGAAIVAKRIQDVPETVYSARGTSQFLVANKWYLISGTFNNNGYPTLYINGVVDDATVIAFTGTQSGDTINSGYVGTDLPNTGSQIAQAAIWQSPVIESDHTGLAAAAAADGWISYEDVLTAHDPDPAVHFETMTIGAYYPYLTYEQMVVSFAPVVHFQTMQSDVPYPYPAYDTLVTSHTPAVHFAAMNPTLV